jgi:hypothetical protein
VPDNCDLAALFAFTQSLVAADEALSQRVANQSTKMATAKKSRHACPAINHKVQNRTDLTITRHTFGHKHKSMPYNYLILKDNFTGWRQPKSSASTSSATPADEAANIRRPPL